MTGHPTTASDQGRGATSPTPLEVRLVQAEPSDRARVVGAVRDIALVASLLTAALSVWWGMSDRRFAADARASDEQHRKATSEQARFDRAWDVVSSGRIDGAELVQALERIHQTPGGDLDALVLSDRHLHGLSLPKASLLYAGFERCIMPKADFTSARLFDSRLVECKLDDAMFDNASLFNVSLAGSTFSGASFDHCQMSDVQLDDARIHSCRFEWTNLAANSLLRTTMTDVSMYYVTLTAATLDWAQLDRVVMVRTDVAYATMRGTRFEKCILSGAERLRADQLATCTGDVETILPPDVARPAHWALPFDEQIKHVESLLTPEIREMRQPAADTGE